MTPEEVANVRALLVHEDPDIQRQGLELAKSFGDYSPVFEGCSIDKEGKIQLSFELLNTHILKGFLESGVVDLECIARMRSLFRSDDGPWQAWIKRGCASEMELTREDFPDDWNNAAELIANSKHPEACKILSESFDCYYLEFANAWSSSMYNESPLVSEFLELICGLTHDEVLEALGDELDECGPYSTKIRKCSFDGRDFIVSAAVDFRFPNLLVALQLAYESNGEEIWFDSGVTFQWDPSCNDDVDLGLTMITDTDETGLIALHSLVALDSTS